MGIRAESAAAVWWAGRERNGALYQRENAVLMARGEAGDFSSWGIWRHLEIAAAGQLVGRAWKKRGGKLRKAGVIDTGNAKTVGTYYRLLNTRYFTATAVAGLQPPFLSRVDSNVIQQP